jgi:PKD repeat protein
MKKIILTLTASLFCFQFFSQKIDFQIESGNYSNCKYSKVKFKNTSTYGINDCNYYKWIFGNGDTLITYSVTTPVEYLYNKYGEFKPILEGYKLVGTKKVFVGGSQNYYTVNLNNPTVFSTSAEAYCPNEVVSFNYNSYNSSTTPKWDFGNGKTSYSTYGASTIYYEPGDYTVKLIYDNNYCENNTFKDTISKTLKISSFVQPNPDFILPNKICTGEPINLYSTTRGTEYEWDMGDKNVYNSSYAIHKYKESWTYDVTLTLTNACGNKKSITKKIEVSKSAKSNFGNFYASWSPYTDKIVCVNEPVEFNFYDSEKYQSISWNFGDQTILNNVEKGEHVYKAAKEYVLQLKLIDFCNNDTILEKKISVRNTVPFNIDWIPTVELCPGETKYFNYYNYNYGNKKSIKSYQWIFPNNQIYQNVGLSKSFTTSTNIQLKLQDYCGRDTTFNQLIKIVNNKKINNLNVYTELSNSSTSGDIAICPNEKFSFSIESDNIKTITCDYGNGIYTNILPYSFSQNGSYPLKIKATNYCGIDSIITKIINVEPIKINNVSIKSSLNNNNSNLCVGDMLRLESYIEYYYSGSYNDISLYEWDFGDGTISYGQNVSHIYSKIGKYIVKLKLTNACDDTLTIFRTFEVKNSNVDLIFNENLFNLADKLCPNELGKFNVYGNFKDVVWDFGDNTSLKGNHVSYKYLNSGIYNVTLKLSNQCGSSKLFNKQVQVRNDVLPELYFGQLRDEICPGENLLFFLEKGNVDYQYTFDFGDNTSTYNHILDLNEYDDGYSLISHKYETIGEKVITLSAKNACGLSSSSQETILVKNDLKLSNDFNNIDVEFGFEFSPSDTSILFIDSHGQLFEWNLGDNIIIKTNVPILKHLFTSIGKKTISVKVTTGCGETSTFTEDVYVTPGNKIVLSTEKIITSYNTNIYPNPSTGVYQLSVSEQMIGKRYTISDLTGKYVRDGIIKNTNQEISLEDVSAGSYILYLENSKAMKLIKY